MEALTVDDPQQAGPYRLVGRLGAGGMGAVYLGRSAGGRAVAVKLVRREFASDEDFRARFRREVHAARAVSGAFTAPVVDADTEAELPWLATAFVPGVPLSTAVRRHGGLDEAVLRSLAVGLAEALQDIHRAGVVHRDLKPSNVMLAADGPHVIDFGISRATDGTALTSTGFVVGSPGFLSPEQVTGAPVGPATDIFALGATLAFAAHGNGPFGDGPTPALLYRVVSQDPDLSGLPVALRPAVQACLAKDPAQRPTPEQLVQLLRTEQGGTGRGGWLPPAVLADIAAAAAVLNGADPADDGGTQRLRQQPATGTAAPQDAAPQGFGAAPIAPQLAPQSRAQQGFGPQPGSGAPQGFGPAQGQAAQLPATPAPFPPTAATLPFPAAEQPTAHRGLSRRALLGLVGGGVVVAGGAATAFALIPGSSVHPKPSPGPSGTGTPNPGPTGSGTPAPDPTVAPGPPGTLAGPQATPVWTVTLDDSVQGMAASNGTLVVACQQTTKGLNTDNGAPRWRGTVDSDGGNPGKLPVISGDSVYLAGSTHVGADGLTVVKLADGSPEWFLPVPDAQALTQSVVGIIGDIVYLGVDPMGAESPRGALWAVDLKTHTTAYLVHSPYLTSLVASPGGPYLFGFAAKDDNDGQVSGVNPADGKVRWSVTAPYATFSSSGTRSGCYSDGKVFFGGNNLHAVTPGNGTPAWPAVNFDTQLDAYNWPFADGQGRVFVTSNADLYAVRARDGAKLWKTTGINQMTIDGAQLAVDGMVYLVDDKSVLYAVDAAGGQCLWSFKSPAFGSNGQLAADDTHVYFACDTQVAAFKRR